MPISEINIIKNNCSQNRENENKLVKCVFGVCETFQHESVCDKHRIDVLLQNHFC
jgi:hypothetical protein